MPRLQFCSKRVLGFVNQALFWVCGRVVGSVQRDLLSSHGPSHLAATWLASARPGPRKDYADFRTMATGLLRQTTAYTTHKDYRDHGTTGKTLKRSPHSPSGNSRRRCPLWLKCLENQIEEQMQEHAGWQISTDRRRWSWLLDVTWHPISSVGHQSWAGDHFLVGG